MHQLLEALERMGLGWEDVWALSADRRAGTLVVVALDGRKVRGNLPGGGPAAAAAGRPRRVKAVKEAVDGDERASAALEGRATP